MPNQYTTEELALFRADAAITLALAVLRAAENGENVNADEAVAGTLIDFRIANADYEAATHDEDN
ncbi:hypothetical protein QP995_08735 [Corynebacterium sp. MSK032]|uniref:hypothetical protein n=1 Tax=Corynebacterium sp. MSK032 TaxID=3050191 RepID=UPI00254F89ED|nr:hypothetical protein [Corynebacterium sp. MSK032]MDK8793708.1 hypothetical protein [Corynebacterium sp. MSK032]